MSDSRTSDSSLDLGSRLLLYMFVLGPLALVGAFLFFLGPLGWITIAVLVFAGMIFQAVRTYDASSTPRPGVRNCEGCGAPTEADEKVCNHCGETLTFGQGA